VDGRVARAEPVKVVALVSYHVFSFSLIPLSFQGLPSLLTFPYLMQHHSAAEKIPGKRAHMFDRALARESEHAESGISQPQKSWEMFHYSMERAISSIFLTVG
jgi:hypothetical protein